LVDPIISPSLSVSSMILIEILAFLQESPQFLIAFFNVILGIVIPCSDSNVECTSSKVPFEQSSVNLFLLSCIVCLF